MDIPKYNVEFTKDGTIFSPEQVERLLQEVRQFTDLLVLSHGWNNNMEQATELYDELCDNVSGLLDANLVEGLSERRFAAMQVYWPSKKFEDKDLIPGGGAASATTENDQALEDLLERMKSDPSRLGAADIDPVRVKHMDEAKALIARLEEDPKARQGFVFRLRAILNASEAHADDGSVEFFQSDPEQLFAELEEQVVVPAGVGAGGAAGLDAGGAASLGDLLAGVKAAARRLVNFTTYYDMKQRAGIVGRRGVTQVLMRLRDRNPSIRLHLIGHSFGGMLVTAAAHALQGGSVPVTLTLLQAAYSHNGLAENYDGKGNNGAFRTLLAEKIISGPIVITHTKNDRAVGIAYPLASRISREKAAALGDENDPYGGMGRNGAQHTPEVDGTAVELLDVGGGYDFKAGKVYNLKADTFIPDHGTVAGLQVAYAVLNVVRSV